MLKLATLPLQEEPKKALGIDLKLASLKIKPTAVVIAQTTAVGLEPLLYGNTR